MILLVKSTRLSIGLIFLYSFILSSSISLGYCAKELLDLILCLLGFTASKSICEFLISLYYLSYSYSDFFPDLNLMIMGSLAESNLLSDCFLNFWGLMELSLDSDIFKSGMLVLANFKNPSLGISNSLIKAEQQMALDYLSGKHKSFSPSSDYVLTTTTSEFLCEQPGLSIFAEPSKMINTLSGLEPCWQMQLLILSSLILHPDLASSIKCLGSDLLNILLRRLKMAWSFSYLVLCENLLQRGAGTNRISASDSCRETTLHSDESINVSLNLRNSPTLRYYSNLVYFLWRLRSLLKLYLLQTAMLPLSKIMAAGRLLSVRCRVLSGVTFAQYVSSTISQKQCCQQNLLKNSLHLKKYSAYYYSALVQSLRSLLNSSAIIIIFHCANLQCNRELLIYFYLLLSWFTTNL